MSRSKREPEKTNLFMSQIKEFLKENRFPLRSRSILFSIFSVLLMSTFVILLLFFHYVSTEYQKQYRAEVISGTFSVLENKMEHMSILIESLFDQMEEITRRQDCSRLMVSDDISHNPLVLDFALYLNTVTQNYNFVDQIWVYFSQSDFILSSAQELVPRSGSKYDRLLADYQAQTDKPTLISVSNKLYYVLKYPSSSPLVTIMVQLNEESLLENSLESENSFDKHSVFFYNTEGLQIFKKQIDYPKEEALMIDAENIERWGDYGYIFHNANEPSSLLLTVYLERIGLVGVTQVNTAMCTPAYGSWISMIWPYVLLAVILLLAASVYLLKKVYVPLQQIVQSLTVGQEPQHVADLWENADSEFDFMRSVMKDNQERQKKIQTIFQQVEYSIQEKLLLSLLQEPLFDQQIIQELSNRSNMLPISAHYGLLYLEWQRPGHSLDELESVICGIHLCSLMNQYISQTYSNIQVTISRTQTVWILRLSEDSTITNFQEQVDDLRKKLFDEGQLLPCKYELGCGGDCDSLFQLKQCYETARSDVQYRFYYQTHVKIEKTAIEHYRKLVLQELMGESENPLKWEDMIDDIVSNHPESAAEIFCMILDTILGKLIELQIEPDKPWKEHQRALEHMDLTQQPDTSQIEWIKEFTCTNVQIIQNIKNSRQYRHVEHAQAYIAEHYSDPSLSLDMVSAQLGMTGSYLSYLFSSCISCGFLDYLNQYRVEQSKKLLLATKLTVSEIGFQCGFNSPQSFIRVFKKYVQKTPGQYRQQEEEEMP